MRALALAALLLVPFAAGAGPAPSATGFTWEAPATTMGPLVVELVFDLGEPQACTLFIATAGKTRASPVLAWEEVDGRPGPLYSTNNAQVHTGAVDSRSVQGAGGAWSMESTYERTWSGLLPVTVIVPQAGSWQNAATGYHTPLKIALDCERGATLVSAAAGREAVAFTADSMKGGTGANLNALLFVEATATRGDALSASFESPEVTLRTLFVTYGGLAQGELRLQGPSGARAWDVAAGNIVHEDAPGDYALALDYTAAGTGDTFVGVLAGTQPVASLDAPW